MYFRNKNRKKLSANLFLILFLQLYLAITANMFASVSSPDASAKALKKALFYFKAKKYSEVKKILLLQNNLYLKNNVWQETLYEAMILNLKSKAYCIKSKIALDKKNLKVALSYFNECKRLSPFAKHLLQIQKEIQKQSDKKMKGIINSATAKKISVLQKKAKKKEMTESWTEALLLWNKVLILNPDNQEAGKHKKKCIIEISNFAKKQEAKKFWKQALVLLKHKKYLKSKFLFEQYLTFFPKDKKAKKNIEIINKELEIISEKAERLNMAKSAYASAIDYKKAAEYKKALEYLQEARGLAPKLKNWNKEILTVQKLELAKFQKSKQHKIEVMNTESRRGVAALLAEKLDLAVNHLSLALSIAEELKNKEDTQYNKQYLKMAKDGLERKNKEEVNENNPFYSLVQKLVKAGDKKYKAANYKDAYNDYEEVRILFPENRLAKQKLILCNLKLHPDGAQNQIKAILTFGKDLMKKKDYRAAKSNFILVKEVRPNYPGIDKLISKVSNALKGHVLQKKITKKEANKRYKQALKIYKQKPALALKKINTLLKLYANHSNALNLKNRLQHILVSNQTAGKYVVISPKAVLYFSKGLRFYTSGNLYAAKKAFEKSLQLSPKYKKAKRALKRVKRQLKG